MSDQDQTRRGYRYRPADVPQGKAETPDEELDAQLDEDEDEIADDELDEEEAGDDQPSEFWPAAEVLKGATIEEAELELSYAASVYVNTPAATLRLWLRMPDGRRRLVQVDEPHTVWFYRQDPRDAENFEEYPDHRFELPSSDLRVMRSRRRRQLIDHQLSLHEQLVAVGEELEQLEQDIQDDDTATADWPGSRWPE
ncbi:MAG: hypothetical protein U0841_04905 [Chloroflexia bacterium]